MTLRSLRWTRHIVCKVGDEKCLHYFRRSHGRDYLANVGMDIRIILKWILRK
jgi:hypothetical protein